MREKEGKKISFKYNLKEYFSFVKNYKLLFFLTLFAVLLLESKQILEKYLFKLVIDKGTLFTSGELNNNELMNSLVIIASIFIFFCIIIYAITRWLLLHWVHRFECNIILDLKRKYFNHIVSLEHNFHVTHKTGSLISRLGRGSRAIEKMSDMILFNLAPLIFQLLILTTSLIYLDITSAIIIVSIVITFVTYGIFIQRIQQSANIEENKAEDIEKGNVADFFTNIDSIKYFGKEKFIGNRFEKLALNTKYWTIKHWDYFRWFDFGQIVILGIGTFALIYFPLTKFMHGEMSLGTLAFIYTAYSGLFGPLNSFMHGMREFYRSMVDFEDLFEYGKIKSSIQDKEDAKDLLVKTGDIEFDNMDFNYGNRKIFKNFSLKIPKNKKIALVGRSGSGKTTLIKLLYRFYDVNKGSIKIDGEDIRNVKQNSLRSEMAIVPQECVLFDDTIYNNIAFSNPDASDEDILKTIKFAQLDKIINILPNKRDTIVGERGVKLSGGEKQRVSIARALLANKKILVLDEATSHLDSQTEHEIQQDLAELMKGRTSIIIAHRLSTIMHADTIIVLQHGKIVQIGKHQELIKQKGEYKKLWEMQKGGYIK